LQQEQESTLNIESVAGVGAGGVLAGAESAFFYQHCHQLNSAQQNETSKQRHGLVQPETVRRRSSDYMKQPQADADTPAVRHTNTNKDIKRKQDQAITKEAKWSD